MNNLPASYKIQQGKLTLEFFNPAFIALQEETAHHPELRQNLSLHPADKFEERLAEIAAYCNVLLEGYYSPERLVYVAEELLKILKSMRTGEVLILGASTAPITPPAKG
jgi:hypothetical protein